MKLCPHCREVKPLDAFYPRQRGGVLSWCKQCAKEYQRGRPPVLLAKRVVRQAKDRPCADCGVRYPYYVMDFDHRPGTTKKVNLTVLVKRGPAQDILLAEIAKCDVVCANCHRARTYQRKRASRNQSTLL
jgi:hypothetical protein